MAVLERSELDASSLADLHAIADQIGLDGFRRLRKAELIDAILKRAGAPDGDGAGADDAGDDLDGASAPTERPEPATARRRRSLRARRARPAPAGSEEGEAREQSEERVGERGEGSEGRSSQGERGGGRVRDRSEVGGRGQETRASNRGGETFAPDRSGEGQHPRSGQRAPDRPARGGEERIVEGVVELLGNGSAFLRVSPPEASDADLYISAAQVRRCELVSGDRVRGPLRTPRQSERFPSLARVDTINGAPAESVAEGTRYEDLAVAYPCERLELDPEEPTLKAIEWLTPIGRGSRAAIVGAARSGKTETLRRLLGALAGREGLEAMLVLSGARPEEIAVWREGPVAPAAAVDLAASADLQSQTVEHVVDTAKRVAARGGDVVVLIDSLDGLHPHVARRVLAAARNLAEGGSLTVVATSTRPLGGESTVIALDVALTSTGRLPALDLARSGVVRPELLVGEDGAEAITQARAAAVG
jgi:transcription termination factor Rho